MIVFLKPTWSSFFERSYWLITPWQTNKEPCRPTVGDIYKPTHSQTNTLTDRTDKGIDTKNRQHNLVLINVVNNVIGLCKELQNWRSPMSPSSERIEGFWVVCVWKTDWLTNWLTEWPPDWLAYWMIDWLTDWLTNWLTDWLADWLTGWLADWLTGWLANWLTGELTDWLTDWLTD